MSGHHWKWRSVCSSSSWRRRLRGYADGSISGRRTAPGVTADALNEVRRMPPAWPPPLRTFPPWPPPPRAVGVAGGCVQIRQGGRAARGGTAVRSLDGWEKKRGLARFRLRHLDLAAAISLARFRNLAVRLPMSQSLLACPSPSCLLLLPTTTHASPPPSRPLLYLQPLLRPSNTCTTPTLPIAGRRPRPRLYPFLMICAA